jgi:hypothetical protein
MGLRPKEGDLKELLKGGRDTNRQCGKFKKILK